MQLSCDKKTSKRDLEARARFLFISTLTYLFSVHAGTAKPFTRPAYLATVSRSTVCPAIANRLARFRVPPPYTLLSMRFSKRFKVYCGYFKGCNIYANILTKGGRGVARTACVFLYYHNTPHEIFRHKVPPTHRPRTAREAWIDPRSEGVVLCSWFEVFVRVVRA